MRTTPLALAIGLALALAFLAAATRAGAGPTIAAAAAAVIVASLVLVGSLLLEFRRERRAQPPASLEVNPLRDWIRSGELGHEEIVRLLDRIDRMGLHPNLSVRSEPEMARLRLLSHARFLELVERRLDEIEGAS